MTIFCATTAHTLLEDGTGHKKMRMEPTARVKRMTPLKQVSNGLSSSQPPHSSHCTATELLQGVLEACIDNICCSDHAYSSD